MNANGEDAKTASSRHDDAPAVAEPQRTKGVDSARRALEILLEFSEKTPELTVENVLAKHNISVPSAYRYISLLRELDIIEEREKGRFVLSPLILRLSRAAESTMDLRDQIQPILNQMTEETGETSLYLRRVRDSAICLAIAESDHPISISFQPGNAMPLYGGAAAKLLLSELSPAELNRYLDRLGPTLSKGAKKKLELDLEPLRVSGYAESAGEVDQGVWASAVKVRSNGVLLGALTIVAPDYRLDDEHKAQIADAVRAAASSFQDLLVHRT
jgi:DNA-binding IclR family transcriptional regulator